MSVLCPLRLGRAQVARCVVRVSLKVNDAKHESQSQAFGRAAHALGAEALLVPSARVPGGMNLVYFPQSLARRSKVEILGEKDLNRWLKKQ